MNFLIVITMFETFIRDYSIVWKNDHGTMVKQVVYDRNDIFKTKKKDEMNRLAKLPYGYRYDLYQINDVDEILYNKTLLNTNE